MCRFLEILRAVCRETLRRCVTIASGVAIAEQTVAAWLLLNETEKMTAFDVRSEEAYCERPLLVELILSICMQHRVGILAHSRTT